MAETRRVLGSLGSEMNVGGEETLRRRVRPEETPLQRQIRRMYERREESWRPLNRQRVEAFIRLFLLCFVEPENGLPLHPVTYQKLKRALAQRIIPFIEGLHPFIFIMFCGAGEWATPSPSHLPEIKESTGAAYYPFY